MCKKLVLGAALLAAAATGDAFVAPSSGPALGLRQAGVPRAASRRTARANNTGRPKAGPVMQVGAARRAGQPAPRRQCGCDCF
jgi:hypothetical protein